MRGVTVIVRIDDHPGVAELGTTARRTAGGALALALALTGCGGGSDVTTIDVPRKTPTAPPPARTTAPPADPQAAHKRAVLASYRAMWAEQMKAYGKADAKGTDLEKYATTDALSKFRADLAHMKQQRTVIRGELGHDPKVTALDTKAKLPTATIEDCVDLAKWQTIDTRTNKPLPLPTSQPRRYMATATAEKWPNGWMVTDYTPDGARTC